MGIENTAEDLPQLNDPKVQEAIKRGLKDISNQMTIVEGYRATIGEAYKGLSTEHKVPLRVLRKMGGAYHRQTFQTEVQQSEQFQEIYEKVFGTEE